MTVEENAGTDSLSALGTVIQKAVRRRGVAARLTLNERGLLEKSLENGLTAPDFYAVWRVHKLARWSSPALLSLLLCERLACLEGSTYLDLEEQPFTQKLKLLGLDQTSISTILAKRDHLEKEAATLVTKDPRKTAPFVISENRLYRHVHFHAETRVKERLLGLLARPWAMHQDLAEVFRYVTEEHPLRKGQFIGASRLDLAFEQQLAALVAVSSPLTVIAGGPGTGKTSIVVTILRLLLGLGVAMENVALAAPTGRAANRLNESIKTSLATLESGIEKPNPDQIQAKTVHRLLGWSPSRRSFRFDAQRPLAADWVIVDEGSMIDLVMMENLLMALKPSVNLILLGDAGQLPSVEAGTVFRDLSSRIKGEGSIGHEHPWQALNERADSKCQDRHVVHLRKSFRQEDDRGGRHILTLSKCISDGVDVLGPDVEHPVQILFRGDPLPWVGACLLDETSLPPRDLAREVYKTFFAPTRDLSLQPFTGIEEDRQRLEQIFARADLFRVLCITNKSRFGVDAFNALFETFSGANDETPSAGMPWMVTRNDYHHGLFNGDIGLSLDFRGENGTHRWLVFRQGGGFRRVAMDNLSGLVPAYAMTVHKSQGSEADHVLLVLPEKKNALCKREVIYTALTRARKSVLIYGSPEVFREAVRDGMQRVSGLRLFSI